mmetsp:Transcript_128002/g.190704  ORF Transcript_128002/g.190704 Transcript_128002/m.190704 type:complete len:83 (+) Transcript_128002:81-329(+)
MVDFDLATQTGMRMSRSLFPQVSDGEAELPSTSRAYERRDDGVDEASLEEASSRRRHTGHLKFPPAIHVVKPLHPVRGHGSP